jgi:hypothetical protein
VRRSRLLALTTAAALTLGFAPVPLDQATAPLADVPVVGVEVPLLSSGVELLMNIPAAPAISATFDPHREYLYQSTLRGIDVYDVSVPERPRLVGSEPMSFFQNEAVSMGVAQSREDGTTFVTVGLDLYGAGIMGSGPDVQVSGSHVYIVDVTDPTNPTLRSEGSASTSTHTVTCVDEACEYAYTAGNGSEFSILDLTDLDDPKELTTVESAFGGHDWDQDGAGVMWQVGWNGAAAWDVTDPTSPRLLNTTDEFGTDPDWNNFILHNSIRPNATTFGDEAEEDSSGRPAHAGRPGRPAHAGGGKPDHAGSTVPSVDPDRELPEFHVDRGNVLLATEEDYIDPTCDTEGNFETWGVDTLDPDEVDARTDSLGEVDGGTITPLGQWNTELFDTGIDTPAGAFCSAHYFDYHQSGIVAQGFYQQGLRLLDVDDPADIRQIGYWVPQASEVWSAYWVPERDEDGRVVRTATGDIAKSDVVYTSDLVRGIDVLRVTGTDEPTEQRATVSAPIFEHWLQPDAATAARAQGSAFGFACPLPSLAEPARTADGVAVTGDLGEPDGGTLAGIGGTIDGTG